MTPLLLLVQLMSPDARAEGVFGLDWVPSGRGDLAWTEAGQLSGDLVGELDGLINPPLTAFGGWMNGRDAALFGLSGARLATRSTGSDLKSINTVGTVRIAADYRRYLTPRQPGMPSAYAQGGLYAVLPVVRDASSALTEDEQAAYDAAASETAARIGGVGGRLGLGAELAWDNGLSLGARAMAAAHRASSELDGVTTTSTWIRGEAALELSFVFGSRDRSGDSVAPNGEQ